MKNAVSRIFVKLGLQRRTEAAVFAASRLPRGGAPGLDGPDRVSL